MSTPRLRPLVTAFGLLLAAALVPLTSPAQGTFPRSGSSNRTSVLPPVDTPTSGAERSTYGYELGILFNATQLAPGTEALDEKIATAFGLGKNTAVLPLGPNSAGLAAAKPEHFFAVSRVSVRKEVVILHVLPDGSIEAFLCDLSGRLRDSAVVAPDGTVRKVGIWRGARKFQAELSVIQQDARINSRRYAAYIYSGH